MMLLISKCEVEKAIDIIKKGGLACFPTETVFGLGCIASKEESFLRMVKVKNRPVDKPFTLMISSLKQVDELVEISDIAKKIDMIRLNHAIDGNAGRRWVVENFDSPLIWKEIEEKLYKS